MLLSSILVKILLGISAAEYRASVTCAKHNIDHDKGVFWGSAQMPIPIQLATQASCTFVVHNLL